MRDRLWDRIRAGLPDVWLNGPDLDGQRMPNNLNIGIDGVQGETMLVNLDLAGIAASAGSACTVRSQRAESRAAGDGGDGRTSPFEPSPDCRSGHI